MGLYVPVEYPERKVSFKERIARVHIIIFSSAHLKWFIVTTDCISAVDRT